MSIIINSVGSNSRDYETLQEWLADIPTDIISSGNSYVAEMYNDSEFVLSSGADIIDFSNKITDATYNLTVRPAAGHAWNDNGPVQTKYNPSNGVALRADDPSVSVILSVGGIFLTIENLQILSYPVAISNANTYAVGSLNVSGCLIETFAFVPESPAVPAVVLDTLSFTTFTNNIVVSRNGGYGVSIGGASCNILFNTIVCPINGSTDGIYIYASWGLNITNNAIFGFSESAINDQSSTIPSEGYTASHNATDKSTIVGTDSLTSLVFADQFVNVTDNDRDFRLNTFSLSQTKTFTITTTIYQSALIKNGVAAGSVTTDIFGNVRLDPDPRDPDPMTHDIGAAEAS